MGPDWMYLVSAAAVMGVLLIAVVLFAAWGALLTVGRGLLLLFSPRRRQERSERMAADTLAREERSQRLLAEIRERARQRTQPWTPEDRARGASSDDT